MNLDKTPLKVGKTISEQYQAIPLNQLFSLVQLVQEPTGWVMVRFRPRGSKKICSIVKIMKKTKNARFINAT